MTILTGPVTVDEYANILWRVPSVAEYRHWDSFYIEQTDARGHGAGVQAEMIDMFALSPEAQQFVEPVIEAFMTTNMRLPLVHQIDEWVNALRNGEKTLDDLITHQIDVNPLSSAYLGHMSQTEMPNEDSISALYTIILNRTGSAAEIQSWLDTGKNFGEVFDGFFYSEEYQQRSEGMAENVMRELGATTDASTVLTGEIFGTHFHYYNDVA